MISVALCTYNGEKFIEEQLHSILNQTLPVDEIVVCDDGSTDMTIIILDNFKLNDSRFKIYQNKKNLGTIKNFEKAISLAKGDIIFLSDQDDIWHLDKVKLMTDFIKQEEKCLLLFTNGNLIDENGKSLNSTLWDKWNFDEKHKQSWRNHQNAMIDLINNINKVTGATVAFKSELIKDILPINTPKALWHDAWIAMHAAYKNGLFFIENTTIDYRIHENQQVGVILNSKYSDKAFVTHKHYEKYINRQFPEFISALLPLQRKSSILKRITKKLKKIFS